MGMFDDIRCKYPLPLPQYQENEFQTKDTPSQWMDLYEIREDGTLWREDYDTEDQSERGKWERENPGLELPPSIKNNPTAWCGCAARVNKRWAPVADFVGEIAFYNCIGPKREGWVEFSAYFVGGKLNQLNLVTHRPEGL